VLADFTDEPGEAQTRALAEAITRCAEDDPDFARKLLVCVNSDVVLAVEPAGHPDRPALFADAVRGKALGLAALALLIVVVVVVGYQVATPDRSVKAYCKTFYDEGVKLHEKWSAQTRQANESDNVFAAIATVAGSPRDLADYFGKLEKVAPDGIQSDVAAVRDAWRKMADSVGDQGADTLSMLAAGAFVGLSVAAAEQRVDTWTSSHCTMSQVR